MRAIYNLYTWCYKLCLYELWHYVALYGCINNLCRPLEISTQEYGKKWPSLSNERTIKVQAPPTAKTMAQFMDTVRNRLGLHPIQIIGMRSLCVVDAIYMY